MSDQSVANEIDRPVISSDLAHPAADPKRHRFKLLAEARTKRVIKAIRILANMGGKNRYSYSFSSEDVEYIATTLELEVAALRQIMVAPGRQMDIEFDLP